MIRVTAVEPGTIGDELGLEPGSELVSVNGRELDDFLDWEYLTAEEQFLLRVRQPSGEEPRSTSSGRWMSPWVLPWSPHAFAGAPTGATSASSMAIPLGCATPSTSGMTTTG